MNFYETKEWKQLRFRVLVHYRRMCMACNATNKVLHVDHIKPISKYPHLRLDFENLQILCEDCNVGKSNVYKHDLRPNKHIPDDVNILSIGSYGYIRATKKVSHIWNGNDTLCKMYSGLKGFRDWDNRIYSKPLTRLCKICAERKR